VEGVAQSPAFRALDEHGVTAVGALSPVLFDLAPRFLLSVGVRRGCAPDQDQDSVVQRQVDAHARVRLDDPLHYVAVTVLPAEAEPPWCIRVVGLGILGFGRDITADIIGHGPMIPE
jgi:hypothetical protein